MMHKTKTPPCISARRRFKSLMSGQRECNYALPSKEVYPSHVTAETRSLGEVGVPLDTAPRHHTRTVPLDP